MSVALTDIREGLAANLAVLKDVQVSAHMLSSPTPPSIHLFPGGPAGDIEYDLAMRRGLDRWPFTVQAFVAFSSDIGAQAKLDKWLAPSGTSSVKQALEVDLTLGDTIAGVHVKRCTGYRLYAFEGRPALLGAEWHLEILAPGT